MLILPSSVRIFLASEPVDMRRSIDGLAALVADIMQESPYSGYVFVFRGRRGDRLKLLVWARNGFVLVYKRLERGKFRFPQLTPGSTRAEIDSTHLALLLEGLDTAVAAQAPRWSPAPPRVTPLASPTGSGS